MVTREPCVTDEWYHCYNRGVDKRIVFERPAHYERFISLLYASNGTKSEVISERFTTDLTSLLNDRSIDRGDPLVDIGAYCLMPTHVHLILKQLQDGGIARFMQKVFTGYTMYFNVRNERAGALFAGTYKAKHIDDDNYLKLAVPYVLLNPLELFDSTWKKGGGNLRVLENKLLAYPYSSVRAFLRHDCPERKITGNSLYDYYDRVPDLATMMREAKEYYRSIHPEV